MKAVKFTIERMPEIRYAKNEVLKELRDVYAQILIRQCSKKLGSADIKDEIDFKNYLILIFEKALELKLSQKEIERLESMRSKFDFLHYGTKADDSIHQFLRIFTALCNGDKKAVESLVSSWPILDDQGNTLSLRRGLDWEYSKALRDDIAALTKDCIREFLQELRETGRIMTSAELEEFHKIKVEPSTDDSFSSSDHDVERATDRPSDTSKDNSDRTTSQESNSDIQQRSISSTGINDDDDKKNTDNIKAANAAKNDSDNEAKLSITLLNLLSWIFELPEWLQERILNSTPIRALLEEDESTTAIYESNYILNHLAKMFITGKEGNSGDPTEGTQSEKIALAELPSQDLIDTSMILNEPTVPGWILPTVAVIGSGGLFVDQAFNGLLQLNELNGIDVC